jgi:glycosyltransferase involved in cell wall biosynthesis
VLPNLAAIGAQRYVLGLYRQLCAAGFSCEILLQTPQGEFIAELPREAWRSFQYKLFRQIRILRTVESIARLAWLLRSDQFDQVFSVTPFHNRLICLFRFLRIIRSRVVIEEHGFPPLYISRRDGMTLVEVIFYRYTFWLYRSADVIRVISVGIREFYSSKMLRQNVRLFPNLIDLARVRTLGAQAPSVSFKPENVNLVSFGRLSRQKNVPFLLRSVAEIAQTLPIRLWIIGDGDQRETLEKLAADLGIADRVQFLGFLENPYSVIRQAQMFLLTSDWEGAPQVIVEAMALGVPVAARDCQTGPAEMIGPNSERGWLVPFGVSESEFGNAVKLALANSSERLERATRACAFVDETYDLDRRATEQLALFFGAPSLTP